MGRLLLDKVEGGAGFGEDDSDQVQFVLYYVADEAGHVGIVVYYKCERLLVMLVSFAAF